MLVWQAKAIWGDYSGETSLPMGQKEVRKISSVMTCHRPGCPPGQLQRELHFPTINGEKNIRKIKVDLAKGRETTLSMNRQMPQSITDYSSLQSLQRRLKQWYQCPLHNVSIITVGWHKVWFKSACLSVFLYNDAYDVYQIQKANSFSPLKEQSIIPVI